MHSNSMERLQLVGFNRCLIFVQVSEWVLCPVVVSVIVGINGLSFQASDGVKLLDGCCSQTSQGTEDRSLDLCYFGIFHRIDQSVLGLGRMVLQLFCGILFAEWCNLVKVHLQVMGHLLGQLILRSLGGSHNG